MDQPPKERRPSKHEGVRYPRQFERHAEPNPVAQGKPIVLKKDDKWKRKVNEWLERREKERTRERDHWEREKHRCKCYGPPKEVPRPYLDSTSNFGPQITALRVGESGAVSFPVWNEGSYPAWSCYVEVYEGPGGYTSPLSAYSLRGRRIITLHPGERKEVPLPWVRRQRSGRIVGIVFDPLLDPIDFEAVEQINRHITSVHYMDLD